MPRAAIVGIALSTHGVSALLTQDDARAAWERPLAPYDAATDEWPELASALRELAAAVGRPMRLHVALVPPAVQVRCLSLPRASERELVHLLRRDLVRYFPMTDEVVVGAAAPPHGSAAMPVVAAVAPAGLLRAVERAARAAGAEVERVVPAHAAWRRAALDTFAAARTGASALVIASDDRIEVLRLVDGWPTIYRRIGRGNNAAQRLREALDGDGAAPSVVLVGDRVPWNAVLEEAAVQPLAAAPIGSTAPPVAARYAVAADGPELVPDEVRNARAASDRRWVMRLAAASLVCLGIAGALELWGTSRAAAALDARRAAIGQSVQSAVAARDAATTVADRLVAIESLKAATPRWSSLLKMLAQRLPDDAYLVSLRAEGDSASLEGVAASAAEVITALRETPEVMGVRADAPIRQELGAGGALVERFAVTLRLAPSPRRSQGTTLARREGP